MAQSLVRLSGLAGILAGPAWFLGYAGFTKLLMPTIGQPGGRVVLGLARLLSLLALVGLFALGIMALMIGVLLLGFGVLRARALPPWSVWPLIVGWATFLPMANVPAVFGLAPDATSSYGTGYVVWALSSAGLLSAGRVALGYALWSERYASAQQLVRVR